MRFCIICVSNWAWMHHRIAFSRFLGAKFTFSLLLFRSFIHANVAFYVNGPCPHSNRLQCLWFYILFAYHAHLQYLLLLYHKLEMCTQNTHFLTHHSLPYMASYISTFISQFHCLISYFYKVDLFVQYQFSSFAFGITYLVRVCISFVYFWGELKKNKENILLNSVFPSKNDQNCASCMFRVFVFISFHFCFCSSINSSHKPCNLFLKS